MSSGVITTRKFSSLLILTLYLLHSASKNVRPPITRSSEAAHWLSILSTELCVRLYEARETASTLWPKTLVFRWVLSGDAARSRQAPFPFNKNLNSETLLKSALKLWVEAFGESENLNGGTEASHGGTNKKVVCIALGFSGLEKGEVGQKSLEGFFTSAPSVPAPSSPSRSHSKDKGKESLKTSGQKRSRSKSPSNGKDLEAEKTDEQLPPRFKSTQTAISGSSSRDMEPPTAPSAKKKKMKPGGIGALFASQAASQAAASASNSHSKTSTSSNPDQTQASDLDPNSWQCPTCSSILTSKLPSSSDSFQDSEVALAVELQRLVQDHEDWHFAMSLQEDDRIPSATQSESSTQKKKKKKRPLDAFFKASQK